MQITPYHIFDHENEAFLINAEQLSAFVVDKKIADILKLIDKKKSQSVFYENYPILKDIGLITDVSSKKIVISNHQKKHPSITHIALFVSQQCNLNCIYCYGDGGQYGNEGLMNSNVATKAVDWLISQSKEKKQLGISFFGGEPFLNYSLIKSVVKYAKKQGDKNSKYFEFGITTNATLLDNDKIDFMKRNRINPVISFDGSKDLQDKQRPFKNGNGSYDTVYYKIKKLLGHLPDSICRATIIDSAEQGHVETKLQETGFKRIELTVASPSLFDIETNIKRNVAKRNVAGLIECLNGQAASILRSVKNRNTEYLKKIKYSGLGWHLCRMIEQLINKQKRYFACGAGKSGVAISVDGKVYLCHRFVGIEKYCLGNVFENTLQRDIYQTSPIRQNRKCINCYAKYFCAGGCYHDNLGMTGSIFSPPGDMCSLMRKLASYAGMIKSKLNDEDMKYLINGNIVAQKKCLFDLY
jgi:uncharacterized protein